MPMSMRIRRLVDEVDEQHHEGMRTIREDLAEHEAGVASRRSFVRTLGVGAVVVGAATAAGVAVASGAAAVEAGGDAPELSEGDVQLVAFSQSLELAATEAYVAAIATKLLDPETEETARSFERHHRDHAQVMGALLPEGQTVTSPNPTLLSSLVSPIQDATAVAAVLSVLFGLEQRLAATYLRSMGLAESWLVAGPIASILPINSQQAVVMGRLAGEPESAWLPARGTTDGAFDPASFPIS
jgi:hypothetical protein